MPRRSLPCSYRRYTPDIRSAGIGGSCVAELRGVSRRGGCGGSSPIRPPSARSAAPAGTVRAGERVRDLPRARRPSTPGSAAGADRRTGASCASAAEWNVRASTPFHAEGAQARTHLAGGLVRERHGQDLRRREHPGGHLVGDAARDRGRLAGPGPGQDAHRSPDRLNRPALFRVQSVEDRVVVYVCPDPIRRHRRCREPPQIARLAASGWGRWLIGCDSVLPSRMPFAKYVPVGPEGSRS